MHVIKTHRIALQNNNNNNNNNNYNYRPNNTRILSGVRISLRLTEKWIGNKVSGNKKKKFQLFALTIYSCRYGLNVQRNVIRCQSVYIILFVRFQHFAFNLSTFISVFNTFKEGTVFNV